MKRIAWGVIGGGAVVAAFAGAAAANATGGDWTADYDVKDAQFVATPGYSYEPWWQLPVTFTHGTGADATTLTGTEYLEVSPLGLDERFVTSGGASYGVLHDLPGLTQLAYNPGAGDPGVGVFETPFGDLKRSLPAQPSAPDSDVSPPTSSPVTPPSIQDALGMGGGGTTTWTGGMADHATLTPLETSSSALVWSAPATFTDGTGPDAPVLTGTEYVSSSTDAEFVTDSGTVFAQDNWGSGFVNLYYDPANGPAQDELETMFGNLNLSPFASLLAPTVVSDLTAPSLPADIPDADMFSALDLGLPSA
ncbi:hypothetical protein KIH27_04360 [Mycobacterium sp. M1]|uniref:Uncharacterized protein n=1 Tax=Mycolicibacter acidiphilus TaxID=2835306 RepID=A0ABS5REV8_9MYCO|nr:hypothetical protein [Mycolicibacter acidiphilus]MBS9532820.1 hypothetical protein [Mycolicibacter acidiphilus]